MSIVIDLIVVAIIALIAVISAKKGFVCTVIEVIGFIAAFLVAFSLSTPLVEVTYDKFIEPPILNSIKEDTIENTTQTADSIWESLPSFVTENSAALGIDKEYIENEVIKGTLSSTENALENLSQEFIKPVAISILETLYAVILIIVLLFVVKILAKLLNKAFSFSIVGKLNTTLGGAIGIIKGVAIALIICEILTLVISFAGDVSILSNENISTTYIFKFLTNVF